jgi:hypothetical protein
MENEHGAEAASSLSYGGISTSATAMSSETTILSSIELPASQNPTVGSRSTSSSSVIFFFQISFQFPYLNIYLILLQMIPTGLFQLP